MKKRSEKKRNEGQRREVKREKQWREGKKRRSNWDGFGTCRSISTGGAFDPTTVTSMRGWYASTALSMVLFARTGFGNLRVPSRLDPLLAVPFEKLTAGCWCIGITMVLARVLLDGEVGMLFGGGVFGESGGAGGRSGGWRFCASVCSCRFCTFCASWIEGGGGGSAKLMTPPPLRCDAGRISGGLGRLSRLSWDAPGVMGWVVGFAAGGGITANREVSL